MRINLIFYKIYFMYFHDIDESFIFKNISWIFIDVFFYVYQIPGDRGDSAAFENKFYDVGPIIPIPQSIRPRFSPHRIEVNSFNYALKKSKYI